MARATGALDLNLLQMALIGYQVEKGKIEEKILEVRARLKAPKTPAPEDREGKAPAKRFLSDAARERIAAAQRKRWAEHRKLTAGEKSAD